MQASRRRNKLSVPGFNELTEVLKRVGKASRTEVRKIAERRDACLLSFTDNRCCIVNKGVYAQPLQSVCFASPSQPFVNDFYRRKSESRCSPRVLQGDLKFTAAKLACSPAHEGKHYKIYRCVVRCKLNEMSDHFRVEVGSLLPNVENSVPVKSNSELLGRQRPFRRRWWRRGRRRCPPWWRAESRANFRSCSARSSCLSDLRRRRLDDVPALRRV